MGRLFSERPLRLAKCLVILKVPVVHGFAPSVQTTKTARSLPTDRSVGCAMDVRPQVLGEVGKLPDIYTEVEISFYLLRRLLGVKGDAAQGKARP